jgi:hypothetical protein
MLVMPIKPLEQQSQRIQVERAAEDAVKVRIENHDERLGWYTSAAITLPLHQLALLEQALQDMRGLQDTTELVGGPDNIIPFPA